MERDEQGQQEALGGLSILLASGGLGRTELCITTASGQGKQRLLAGPGARKRAGGCDSLPQDNPERVLCCEAD